MSHGSVNQWCVDSHEPSHSQIIRLREPCLNSLSFLESFTKECTFLEPKLPRHP
ncbi:hypothetical protein HAX54_012438, partial [Datura stramonium]|nr:hypothetical protein [Datura stramonium]